MKYLLTLLLIANLSQCGEKEYLLIYKNMMDYKPVNGHVTHIKELYRPVDDDGKLKESSWQMTYALDHYHRVTESYIMNTTLTPFDTSGSRKTYFSKDNRIDSMVANPTGTYQFVSKYHYINDEELKIVRRNKDGIIELETHATYDENGRPTISFTSLYNIQQEVVSKMKDEFKYENKSDWPISHSTSYYNKNDQLIRSEKRVFKYGEFHKPIAVKVYNEKDSLVQSIRQKHQLDHQENSIKTTTYVNDTLNMVVEREFIYK